MKFRTQHHSRRALPRSPAGQRGVMLLEALVAIAIFAVGVLGLIGLQARAINMTQDAQYIARAAALANQYLAQAYISDPTLLSTGTPAFIAWKNQVVAALPGADLPGNAPTATFDAGQLGNTVSFVNSDGSNKPQLVYQAKVQVHWQLPHGSQRTYTAYGSVNVW